jgi:hypothetical protein
LLTDDRTCRGACSVIDADIMPSIATVVGQQASQSLRDVLYLTARVLWFGEEVDANPPELGAHTSPTHVDDDSGID